MAIGPLIFLVVAVPWALLLLWIPHPTLSCPAAVEEAAVLYSPLLHAALVTAYAGPPWFVLESGGSRRVEIGSRGALTHRRLQWIIFSRLLPTWLWLYAFLYNYRHDDVAVFVAFIMFCMCCVEYGLRCGECAALAMVAQMTGAIGLVVVSAEDARLCGERVL